jgi:DNA-binding SARP family transcriptional activator/class 3 adenylate cyclase
MSAQAQPDVEFLLLGPLDARYRQRPLRLGSIKHRMILAKLLLHANQVVSTDELIDTVWGEHPPNTVRQSLQNHVAALRKAIEPDSRGGQGRMLLTRDPGYLIQLASGQTDLHRFQLLVEQGRRALADDQPIEAAGLLHRALGLWRGPALADVLAASDLDWPEVIGVEEQRVAATEACIEADLALGRHADLVGELKLLVRKHPLREQLHGHLMLALYRSGRQAEALAAYRTARQSLIDELGIEPSLSLQRLEQAILAQDAALELLAPVRPMVRVEEPSPAAQPAVAAPLPPSTERKLITVLFADVDEPAGEFVERDPEDVSSMLAGHLERVRAQVDRFGGTIEHAVGGTTMAVFGVPRTREDDPERAVRAALAIREALLSPASSSSMRIGPASGAGPGADDASGTGADGQLGGSATAARQARGADAPARTSMQLRIAVVTGEALVKTGEGAGEIMGDMIGTGALLQQAAPPGTIMVSEATERATARAINYGPPSLLSLRGRAKPVTVWSALQPRNRTGLELTLTRTGGAPLVGRERELATLVSAYEAVKSGQAARMVTLVGPPGIGKSRLVAELGRLVEADTELIAWRVGRSLAYGEATAFGPLAEIVKAEAGIVDTDTAVRVEHKLAQAASYALPNDPATADWVAGHLRLLVSTTGVELLDKSGQDEALTAWRRFLFGLATRRTLVLAVEDLHQADDALLDFLASLVDPVTAAALAAPRDSKEQAPPAAREPVGAARLLVVAAARTKLLERRPELGSDSVNADQPTSPPGAGQSDGSPVLTIHLGPLSEDETTRLLGTLLTRHGFPGVIHPELLSRVAGNPLFAEEYVRMLRDRRLPPDSLAASEQFLHPELRQPSPPLPLPLPETVHAIIAARLDALPVDEKLVLQQAAVLGHAGWAGAIATISGQERAGVEASLNRLDAKEFIRWVPRSSVTGELEYEFRHVLVRDVAYGQIPRAQRAGMHRRAAQWLEALGAGNDGGIGDRAELLAYQYRQALSFARATNQADGELVDRTRLALRAAGDRAASFGLYTVAARYYLEALELWPAGAPDLSAMLLRTGQALCHGEGSGEELLIRARDGFLAEGDRERAGEAEVLLGILAFLHGNADRSAHLETALRLVQDLPASPSRAKVLRSCMMHLMVSDQYDEAIQVAKETLAMATELKLWEIESSALGTIGAARVSSGDSGGINDIERCIRLCDEQASFSSIVWRMNLAEAFALLGDLRRCGETRSEAHRLAQAYGAMAELKWMELDEAAHHYWNGRWDEVVHVVSALVDVESAPQRHYLECHSRIWRGRVRLARGDTDGALEDAALALQAARETKDPQNLDPALAFGARVLLTAGRVEEARGYIEELLAGLGDKLLKPTLGGDLGICLVALGYPADTLDTITLPSRWLDAAKALVAGDALRAAGIYAQIGSRPDEAYARLEAARQLPAHTGRPELDAAMAFYREVNAVAYLSEAEAHRYTYA